MDAGCVYGMEGRGVDVTDGGELTCGRHVLNNDSEVCSGARREVVAVAVSGVDLAAARDDLHRHATVPHRGAGLSGTLGLASHSGEDGRTVHRILRYSHREKVSCENMSQ